MADKKLPLTLGEFSKNPGRDRTIPIAVRENLRALYSMKFAVLMNYYKSIKFFMDKTEDGIYYFYIKIPSETVRDFFYDVVIKLIPPPAIGDKVDKLDDYFIQVFSNDPAFAFTYAYAYNKEKLIVSELVNKFPDEFISDKPKVTNPRLDINYSKIIYFGYLYLKQHGYFSKKILEKSKIKQFDFKELQNLVLDVDKKIAERIQKGNVKKQKLNKKENKHKSTAAKLQGGRKTSKLTPLVKSSKVSKKTKTTKTVKRK